MTLLGDDSFLDSDNDGDEIVEIPEEMIIRELVADFVVIDALELDSIMTDYAIANRQKFRDGLSKDAQFASQQQ